MVNDIQQREKIALLEINLKYTFKIFPTLESHERQKKASLLESEI